MQKNGREPNDKPVSILNGYSGIRAVQTALNSISIFLTYFTFFGLDHFELFHCKLLYLSSYFLSLVWTNERQLKKVETYEKK